ncbi:MAG: peptide ABC transporter substrate-binding protein, partial [Roseiflexaceae bacterium]|nr:peptide ABC transporter substrate-binding protein [Roseiflexaceae bacterium]
ETAAPAAADATAAPAAEPVASGEAGVFRINLGGEPSTADPQVMSFSDEITFGLLNYQPLMSFNLDLEAIPGAAESVEVSEDGTVYTFTLRPDSQYSDGSPLTAEDFEYAWKRLADPALAGNYQFIGCDLIAGFSEYAVTTCPDAEGNTATVTDLETLDLEALREGVGVNAVDESTLEITLEQATPYFPSIAAMWVGAPVRQSDVETADDWWYSPETYIGNGPFVLTEWDHENRAVWEPNPNYNGPLGPVQLQRIEFAMITEGQVAFEAYRNGELDRVGLAREDLATVEGDATLSAELGQESPRYSFYIGYNTQIAPFDDVTVRQAFSYAIDREAFVTDVLGGLAVPAYTFIPPGIPGYLEGETPYDFDADRAKEVLAEAGYANGEGLPEIKLTYGQSARNQTRFEFIANQIRTNLGVEVTLDPIDPNAYSSLFDAPETTPQMFFLGWGPDFPDPQNYYSTVFKTGTSSAARTGFSSPAFDELTVQADREPDPETRLELYKQASDILLEEAPVTFIYYDLVQVLTKPYVTGMGPDDTTPLDPFPGFYNLPNVTVAP